MRYPLARPQATPHFQAAIDLLQKLLSAGFETYLAGGWVRDQWLKRQSQDIDIATAAPIDVVEKLLPKTIHVGASFGCLIAPVGPWHFEVTTFRQDGKYLDGRHPKSIEAGSAQDDAQRRDFTINGLFYDVRQECILDFVGGVADLDRGLLRAIGDPRQRFCEDKLRLLRCARFAAQLDFTIEEGTKSAVIELALTLRSAVSKERIWQELAKLLSGPNRVKGCSLLYELKLAQALGPALPPFGQMSAKTIGQLERAEPSSPLIYQLLTLWMQPDRPGALLGEPKEIAQNLQALFALSRYDKHRLDLWLAMQQLSRCDSFGQRAQWCALFSDLIADECLTALLPHFEKGRGDELIELRDHLKDHIERMRARRPLLNALMLQKRGVVPGPQLGQLLRFGEILAIELDLQSPQQVLDCLFEQL